MSRQHPAVLDKLYAKEHSNPSLPLTNLYKSISPNHQLHSTPGGAGTTVRQSLVMASLVKQSLSNYTPSSRQLSIVQLASRGGMSHRSTPRLSDDSPVLMKLSDPQPPSTSIDVVE